MNCPTILRWACSDPVSLARYGKVDNPNTTPTVVVVAGRFSAMPRRYPVLLLRQGVTFSVGHLASAHCQPPTNTRAGIINEGLRPHIAAPSASTAGVPDPECRLAIHQHGLPDGRVRR